MSSETEIKLVHEFVSAEAFKEAIQKAPATAWLKERSLGGTKKAAYLPIHFQESIADKVFREWEVIDERYTTIVNEIVCTVKIRILPDYPNADERFITGSAANPIQVDSETPASKFPLGKKTNALQYNLPACRSLAISNALETFGNVFGRNVSRSVVNNHKIEQKAKS